MATVTVEFRLEKPVQEALDDVRDAVQRMRSDLPATCEIRSITKVRPVRSPILTYAVSSPAHGRTKRCRGSSTTRSPRLLAVRGVGAVAASAASTARCASSSIRPPAGAERHRGRHLAPDAQRAAGGLRRSHRRGRRRAIACARSPPCATARRPGGLEIALPRRPPRAAGPGGARDATPWPSRAPRRCWTASRWSASRSRARAAPARVEVAEGVRAALDELNAQAPGHQPSPRPSTSSTRCRRTSTAR